MPTQLAGPRITISPCFLAEPKVGQMRARPLRQRLSRLNRSSRGRVRIDYEGGRLPVRADETFGSDCCLSMFPDSLGDGGDEL
jgi:hypothetical protein